MFSKAIVRPPASSFAKGLSTSNLGTPDYARALKQHAGYCEALERCGLTLTRLEPDERYPDSTFVEDTAVLISALAQDRGRNPTAIGPAAIIMRPGAPSRSGEVDNISESLSHFFPKLHSIHEPGTIDGGDVCEADNHFFIGVSERTNEEGAEQLAQLVKQLGYSASRVDIRSVRNLLHLKSGLAYLGNNRMVVIDELADEADHFGYDPVRVNASEQYAANCVRVNDYVLIAAGYPMFEASLQKLGYKTLPVEMTEFQKMDGGLSCLSLRF